jgi:hypothetical protein
MSGRERGVSEKEKGVGVERERWRGELEIQRGSIEEEMEREGYIESEG